MFAKQILAILALTPASMGTRLTQGEASQENTLLQAQSETGWDSSEEFFDDYANSVDGLAQIAT